MKRFIVFLLTTALSAAAQAPQERKQPVDKAAAYYHFSMGHLYAELAGAYGNRGEYLNQAIDHYRQALKADPFATFLSEELADIYIQSGRIREGVTEAETALRDNADDLNARRILGRIYMRIMGDAQQGKINEGMLQKAVEQYSKVVEKQPADIDSWLMLGRLYKVAQNSVDSEKAFKKALELEPENEDAMAGLATVYLDLGDSRRATDYFKKLAEKSPNLRTLTALAGAYEQMRDYNLAAETLKRALEVAQDSDEIKRALAQNLLLADKLEEALKIYEELVAGDPKDTQSLLRISQIYRQQRKFDKARQYSDQAKQQDPNSLEILYNEVGIFEAEGKPAEAINALKTVVESTAKRSYTANEKNNRAMLLERLGLLYRSNEQYKEALEVFREQGALDASVAARAAAQIIDTHRQAREFKKAEEEAEAAFKKWPDDRTVRVVRASVLADVGKGEVGAADLKKLLDGKNDRETYLSLVQIYEKSKNFGEMAKTLEAAEKLSMSNDEKEVIHFMRGAMFEKQKKLEQSESEFRRILAMNPNSASALNYLGYMLADRNQRLSEALDLIKKALDQEPNNGAYLDSLGWAYFRLGKLDEAESALKRALERTGKDPTVHDHLGDVYSKKGDLKAAVAEWELSVRMWQTSAPAEQDSHEIAKVQKKLDQGRVRLAREQKAVKQ